jgi:hypothetical protein
MHSYHDALPGFSPEQILHDGCGECESRAASRNHGIANLDTGNFARAWQRAARWNRSGLPDIARAEVPMLDVLWAVQCQLERVGIPIGSLPTPSPAQETQ